MSFWDIIIPEAATNLVAVPSMEDVITGWTAVGGSAAKSSAAQKRGVYSLAVTPTAGTGDGVYYGTVSLTSGTTYTFSVDIKGAAGIPMKIYFADTSAVLKGTATTWTASGNWERKTVSWACDSTTTYRVYVIKNNSNSTDVFYVDGAQVEAAAYDTTYVDGDQEGCRWLGTAHNSQSSRSAQSRAGGRVYDLTTYGFYVTEISGAGMPPVESVEQAYAILPGSEYEGYKVHPRTFALIGEEIGTSRYNLHGLRKSLIDAIKPDRVSEPEPFILRYRGANNDDTPVEIRCVYGGGLELGGMRGFSETIGIQLIAHDPYWYEVGSAGAVLDTNDSATYYYIAMRSGQTGRWSSMGCTASPTSTTDTDLLAILPDVYNPDLVYIGGYFKGWNGQAGLNCVAKYSISGDTWNLLGGSSDFVAEATTDGAVGDMAQTADGTIYAVGWFDVVNGSTDGAKFAKFATTSTNWEAVVAGAGVGNGYLDKIEVDRLGKIFISGPTSDWDGSSDLNYVVGYNGSSTWENYTGTSITGHPNQVVFDNANTPYLVGSLPYIGGLNKWNGTDWEAVSDTSVGFSDMAIDDNGRMYLSRSSSDSILWRYSGGGIEAIGGRASSDDYIEYMEFDPETNLLHAANALYFTYGSQVYGIFNGSVWVHPDVMFPADEIVTVIALKNGSVYLGLNETGTFSFSGATTVTNGGSERAYPVMRIKRAGGTYARLLYIENFTTGKKLYFEYALADGETLTIDCRMGMRKIESSYYGAKAGALLRGSDFSEFYLQPGANTILAFVDESGTPTVTATMEWRNTHWSIDGGST